MNVPLIVAGSLAILGAAIHGIAGEILVVRKLSLGTLPASPFGGPRLTKAMIRASWQMTTTAFVTVGCALLLSGTVLEGDTAKAMAMLAAGASTGFAAIAVGLGAASSATWPPPRSMLLHPGPALLSAVAALAWWGAL